MDNREILKYCPNFYKIMEFEDECFDGITGKLINVYREYIFHVDINNLEDIQIVKNIDEVLSKYIDDYSFRKTLQERIPTIKILKGTKDILKVLVQSMISIFEDYQEYTTRVIYLSRWI